MHCVATRTSRVCRQGRDGVCLLVDVTEDRFPSRPALHDVSQGRLAWACTAAAGFWRGVLFGLSRLVIHPFRLSNAPMVVDGQDGWDGCVMGVDGRRPSRWETQLLSLVSLVSPTPSRRVGALGCLAPDNSGDP